uniref:Uncharacterized protein n=1 Tax=Tanacetum cinerariifolium TaxID=118510 RepID=A0A6L2K5M1_TANCI|nr:hypothetical protein [Tanacetum cinerariifolium]
MPDRGPDQNGTVRVDDYPDRILYEASIIALPLALVALFPTVFWVLITFQTPTVNAPERLASTIVRAVTTHLAYGSDVYVVYFTNFLFLVLYYLQFKVGSYLFSGLAHLLCLILLFIEKVAPRKRIMVATVLLATIVLTSDDHPSEIVKKFVSLVTTVSILASIAFAAIVAAIVICTEQLNRKLVMPVTQYLFAERDVGDVAAAARGNVRNEMIASSRAPPTTVFRQLDAVDGVISPMCVEEAVIDEPDGAQHLVAELGYPTDDIEV